MDKLKMAHEWALENMFKDEYSKMTAGEFAKKSFDYADAMQAEADKREDRTRPEVLEEWQPDWSQAPALTTGWSVHSNGSAKWHISHGSMTIPAPLFGYTGNWKDSLRKRPSNI